MRNQYQEETDKLSTDEIAEQQTSLEDTQETEQDEATENMGDSISKTFKSITLAKLFKGDPFLWVLVFLLMGISLLFITSSAASLAYKHHDGNTFFFFGRRFMHIIAAVIVLFVVYRINAIRYFKWAKWINIGGLAFLASTFVLGVNTNDAVRAIEVPLFGSMQPSDYAKITMIIMLAFVVTKYRRITPEISFLPIWTWISQWRLRSGQIRGTRDYKKQLFKKNRRTLYIWRNYSWRFLAPIVLVAALILPSNLSTALVVSALGLLVLIIGKVRFVEIFKLGAVLGSVAFGVIYMFYLFGIARAETWISRITSMLTGDESDQSLNAKIAIAEGILPQGPGNSVQRALLPRAESDFMFAFLIEEYSIIVAALIICLYVWIFHRTIVVSRKILNTFESVLCTGLGLLIVFQALVHMMVNVGLMPVTGLTLPFLSNGGSALVSMAIVIGIIQNICARQIKIESGRMEPTTDEDLDDMLYVDYDDNEEEEEEEEDRPRKKSK